jgi:hypothetical protein
MKKRLCLLKEEREMTNEKLCMTMTSRSGRHEGGRARHEPRKVLFK